MSLQDGRKVIALDFDGVLHEYHGWNGGVLSAPIPGMLLLVDTLRAEGAYVVVHTTRDRSTVHRWLSEHGFPELEVYNEKWKRIDVFVDDRAVCFTPEWLNDVALFARRLLDFEPHWKAHKERGHD